MQPATTTSRSSVTNADIEPYIGFVVTSASRLAGTRRARQAGAEYDDLYQEGLISVWQSLQRGVNPLLPIQNRMKDWVRYALKLKRHDTVAYGVLLPLEDLRTDGPAA